MKYLRALLLTAVILSFALAAAADGIPDIHIIFDPSAPANPNMLGNLYEIASQGTVYNVSWLSCSAYSTFNPAPSYDACLGFFNNTGANLSSFDLSFTVPSSGPGSILIGQPVTCTTLGSNLTSNTCPSGTLAAGDTVDASFFGGTPVPNQTAFFVGEEGVSCSNPSGALACSNLPPTQASDTAPEPSTLLLIPTGLLILGLEWGWRRHQAMSA